MNYILWFEPTKEQDLQEGCPFLNLQESEYQSPTVEWPNGYSYLVQELDSAEFSMVDDMANNHVAIDIQEVNPTLYPPFSPTGR